MNLLNWLRHLFCRDVVWRYPDLAALDSNRNQRYPLKCRSCGYKRTITSGELRDALAPQP